MNAGEHDQEFEKLQRLLKLKRHEQPHPRYFNDFSSQVTARIRAGERGSKHETDESAAPLWLQRLWRTLEAKPAASGVFAAAVCGLVLAGILLTDTPGGGPTAPPNIANTFPTPLLTPDENPPALPFANPNAAAITLATSSNSSGLVPLPGGSLFGSPLPLETVPVSAAPGSVGPR